MFERETIADLIAYHHWANGKLLGLCRHLTDEQLDREEPIGPGSLRNVLFHCWGAESLWLSRWKGSSPTSLPKEDGLSIAELAARFELIHAARNGFLAEENPSDLSRIVSYRTLAGDANSQPLVKLLLHVVNHGVHHRAQALQFLKLAGVTIPGGLDYIFYRLAAPTTPIPAETRQRLRGCGLEIGAALRPANEYSLELVRLYFAYGDWMMNRMFDHASGVSDGDLDRDFNMGMGTLRKTLMHIYDAEDWWRDNWRGEKKPFPRLPETTSIRELQSLWRTGAERRHARLAGLRTEQLLDVVDVDFGTGPMAFRMGESMLQLGVHGTHHRAQAINMLRRFGATTTPTDLVVFVRETN